MSNESAFHDGYRKAMEDASALLKKLEGQDTDQLTNLLAEIESRIERARCLARASVASQATGDQGY